jgi:hypothetical protein
MYNLLLIHGSWRIEKSSRFIRNKENTTPRPIILHVL